MVTRNTQLNSQTGSVNLSRRNTEGVCPSINAPRAPTATRPVTNTLIKIIVSRLNDGFILSEWSLRVYTFGTFAVLTDRVFQAIICMKNSISTEPTEQLFQILFHRPGVCLWTGSSDWFTRWSPGCCFLSGSVADVVCFRYMIIKSRQPRSRRISPV